MITYVLYVLCFSEQEGGTDLDFTPSLSASRRAVWVWEAALDMTREDSSFGSETSAGDPGSEDCTADCFLDLKWHSGHSRAVSQTAVQLSNQSLVSQMFS